MRATERAESVSYGEVSCEVVRTTLKTLIGECSEHVVHGIERGVLTRD